MTRTSPSHDAESIVLNPSWVLAFRDDELVLLRDHAVVVHGDTITAVTPQHGAPGGVQIDLPGHLLMPGLISAHTHVAPAASTRGQLESHPFIREGKRSYFRLPELLEELDDEDLDVITAFNLADMMRCGATTLVEQSCTLRQMQSYVRVARRWGTRGYPSSMVPGWLRAPGIWMREDDQALWDAEEGTLAEIAEALAYAQTINGVDNGRIRPMMGPHSPETHTPTTLQAISDAAAQLGHGIHTHLATLAPEAAKIEELWGKTPVQWLDEFGFYDQRFFGAHMAGWTPAVDAPFLAGKDLFTFAHCPSAAGAGAVGAIQPFIEMLAAGIRTAIGLDTHSTDMVENMKLAVLFGRARHDMNAGAPSMPTVRPTVTDMVRAATLAPADGLGRDDLGRIAVGAKADLISIDLSGFVVGAGTPPVEPLNNLLYANGTAVSNVMIDGVFTFRDGVLVSTDEEELRNRAGEINRRLWDQLEREGWY